MGNSAPAPAKPAEEMRSILQKIDDTQRQLEELKRHISEFLKKVKSP